MTMAVFMIAARVIVIIGMVMGIKATIDSIKNK